MRVGRWRESIGWVRLETKELCVLARLRCKTSSTVKALRAGEGHNLWQWPWRTRRGRLGPPRVALGDVASDTRFLQQSGHLAFSLCSVIYCWSFIPPTSCLMTALDPFAVHRFLIGTDYSSGICPKLKLIYPSNLPWQRHGLRNGKWANESQ